MGLISLVIDREKCVGCQTCEVACKQGKNLGVGPKPMRVIQVGPVMTEGRLQMRFVPMRCMHCVKPACMEACQFDAIRKREDGIVLIQEDLCVGCKSCIEACRFGAVQFDEEKGVAVKCSMCVERLDAGLEPMCVKHCPAGAVSIGDVNVIVEKKRQRANLL